MIKGFYRIVRLLRQNAKCTKNVQTIQKRTKNIKTCKNNTNVRNMISPRGEPPGGEHKARI